MDKCCEVAALFVASLKGMALVHQHSHWTTKGDSFYGDHLLFKRLYDSAIEDLDTAAEKFMGLFGEECLDFDFQSKLLNKVLNQYSKLQGSPVEMSLAIEKDFVKFCKTSYDCFEKEGKMTLGLDDMIMSLSSNREESIYLLKQVLSD